MVQVVTGHSFHNGVEGHGAALRVSDGLGARGRQSCADELQVPLSQRSEGSKSLLCGEALVVGRPLFLIEWLQSMVVLGKCLAKAEGEGDFAICEVADDLGGRPLARCR